MFLKSYQKVKSYCQNDDRLLAKNPNSFELLERICNFKSKQNIVSQTIRSLKIISLNVNGKLGEKLELGHPVRSLVESHKPDLIFFLETLVKKRNKCPSIPGYKLHFKSARQINRKGRPSGGFAVYINEKFQPRVNILRSSSENIIAVGVKNDDNERVWCLGVYMRPCQDLAYYLGFFLELDKIMKKTQGLDERDSLRARIYLVGDFNTRLGEYMFDSDSSGKYISHKHSRILLDFVVQNKFQIENKTHEIFQKTFVGAYEQHFGSIVDYVLAPTDHGVQKFEVLGGLNCDHRALHFEIPVKITQKQILKPPRYILCEMDEIKCQIWKFYLARTNVIMQEIFSWAKKNLQWRDPLKTNQMILEVVTTVFYFCWEICLCLGVGYRSPRHWHSSEFHPEVAFLESELQNAIQNKDANLIFKTKIELRKWRQKWSYQKWNKCISQIEREGLYSKTFNRIFRSKKDCGGITDAEFKNHFQKVFGKKFTLDPKVLQNTTPKPCEYINKTLEEADDFVTVFRNQDDVIRDPDGFFDKPPSYPEIEKAIEKGFKTKADGAPGIDRITWRLLYKSMGCISVTLHELLGICWREKMIPKVWGRDRLVTLRKSEENSHSDPGNYRPIFLQCIPFKVLDRVVDTRLQDWIEKYEKLEIEQGGFVRRRGTIEQSCTLREICSIMKFQKRNLYVAFLDCKAAFDRVARPILLQELFGEGIRGIMWKVISAMYDNTTALVGFEILKIECGIREGGMSSPTCFNIHFKPLASKIKSENAGIKFDVITVSFLFFADDIALVSESPIGLQAMLNLIWKHAQDKHFSFGIKKCRYIKQEWMAEYKPLKFTFGSHELQEAESPQISGTVKRKLNEKMFVPTYKYLGISETLDPLNYDFFFYTKRNKFLQRLQKVKVVGGQSNGLRPKWARQLYTSQLRPILEFGSTVFPWSTVYIQKLEVLQLRALKQLFGFRPKTKNETVRILCGIPSMRCRIAQLKIAAFRKLELFDDDFYLKKLVYFECDRDSGLNHDVKTIARHFSDDLEESKELEDLIQTFPIDGDSDFETFKSLNRELLERIDHRIAIDKLKKSCTSGTNQPANVLKLLGRSKIYHLCPILEHSRVSRCSLSKYLQVLAGCDFITPFRYDQKPKCRFCRDSEASWKHILFECRKCEWKLESRIEYSKLHVCTANKLKTSFRNGKVNDLLDLVLMLDTDFHYKEDLKILSSVIAKLISEIESAWAQKEDVEDE